MSYQPDQYEHWDLRPPELAPRSVLSQLRPIGIGSPETECLTSYLSRLANTHQLTIGILLLGCLIPHLRAMPTESDRESPDSLLVSMHTANGADMTAAKLVRAVEEFTLTTGAQWTTLILWRQAFSRQFLQRRFRAWCADCYAEQSAGGGPLYDLLLWTLAPVKICPHHRQLLTESCPQCQKRLWTVQSRYLPGFCSYCQAWLGASRVRPAVEGSSAAITDLNGELWAADQIGHLIAAAPSLPAAPVRQNVTAAIKHCCNILMEGNGRILSHLLGMSNMAGRDWCRGTSVPSLNTLVKLSYLTRVPLLRLLTDPTGVRDHLIRHPIEISAGQRLAKRPPIRPNSPAWQKVCEQMKAAVKETPPPSLADVTRRLGYRHIDSLQTKFPELSKQIAANHRGFKKEHRDRPVKAPTRLSWENQRQMLEQALRQPSPDSLSVLVVRMGYSRGVQFLTQKFPALCQAVLKKRRQVQRELLKKRLRHCREVIDAALVESPPPSLQEVARRVGDKTPDLLWRHFPDDCLRITNRWTAHRSQWLEERLCRCRETIDTALAEEPPPTLEEVAKRAKVISDFLRQYFAEDCRRIAERRAEFRRKQFQERETRLKQSLLEEPPRSVAQLAAELGASPHRVRKNHPGLCGLIVARYQAYRRNRAEQRKKGNPPGLSLEA